MCRIIDIKEESPSVKTYFLDRDFDFKPGQFGMVWIPGVDEKPFGFSSKNSISVAMVGEFTKKMHSLKIGDLLGIRGPYGNNFESIGDKILAVSGGIGSAPIISTIEAFSKLGISITSIIGGRTKEELLFLERFQNCGTVYPCTDDCSFGFHGFTTEKMEELLSKEKYDMIITCGPEIMMKKVIKIAEKYDVPVQLSLERYMKCGIGICGQCAVDNEGLCICKDGPVFWDNKLKFISEFGEYKRDASGAVFR